GGPVAKKKRASTRRWVRHVKTDSTAPPPGTFNRPAAEVARVMARKDVSPKGPGSGIRMIQYFINRAGKSLSPTRRAELERAKRILQRQTAGGSRAVKSKKR
ncbi:MAG: DUF3175 domain-containing protein, partial [Vicinamibacterales bacterium]